ncbi:unnamed protein product [Rodentolepis nana]|uniref:LSDAT_euk domain-containing protein n=1 Tax=Rodentolepis nana TaxID=102285 RepID=A0A158QHG6_RODNA|nr:unnamed protein product [Rodentolepis nana]
MDGSGAGSNIESKDDFIKSNFTYKECQLFIPIETEDGSTFKCGCGEMEFHHFDEETDYFSEEWMPYLIASMGPTNAYGVVDFYTGIQNLHKSSEYVRVSDDDDPRKVIELMLKHWKLLEDEAPLLCISVLGGLDSAIFDSKKRDVFCEGLINIVSATNAWITTFGLNCGVARVVSEAISLAETYFIKENGESPKITCIGVTPWGDVRSHYNLVKSVYSKPNAHITYGVSNVVIPNEAISLNKNHTHYILVDNGMRNNYQRSNIFQYRDKIDQLIATPQTGGGCGVPVVTLVLGGGFDVIENVAYRASQGMPIIICGSTGGAAEILQRICQYKANKRSRGLSATQINEMREMLEQLLESSQEGPNPDWTVEKGIELLQNIAANERFLSYFALGVESRVESLDKAFLKAIIKCSAMNPVDQCNIALKFGCVDMIKQQLIENPKLRSALDGGQINELVTAALLENQCEFIEVMIEQEVVEIPTYLKMSTLNTLYNHIDDPTILGRSFEMYGIQKAPTASNAVRKAKMTTAADTRSSSSSTEGKSMTIPDMLKQKKQKIYQAEWTNLRKVKKLLRLMLGNFESENYAEITPANSKTMFPQPMQELFIWAILNNRHEMALIFWRNANESLPLSIIACNIYQKMISTLPGYDTEGRRALAGQKDYFEQSAKTMIELCYEKSQWKSLYLLVRPFTTWGELHCIPLALNADCQDFVSSNACQHVIQLDWQSGIEANSVSVVLAYLFPPLIFTNLVKFSKSRIILPDSSDPEIYKRLKESIARPGADDTLSMEKISSAQKIHDFYNTPRTKFCVNTTFYAIFLIFFSYTILFGMEPGHISILEIVLMVYLACFSVETIRSLLIVTVGQESSSSSLRKWLHNNRWHGYDLALILPTILTMCLRIGLNETYLIAKSCYSVLLIFYFMRIFQMYAVNRRLGPQAVMIFRMLIELGIFILVLIVFLLPYGVASQAMLYPNLTSFKPSILKDIFYYPYYRLYGELNLEQAEGIPMS